MRSNPQTVVTLQHLHRRRPCGGRQGEGARASFAHDSCIRATLRDRFWRLTALTLPSFDVSTSGREVGSPAHQQRLRHLFHGVTVFPSDCDASAVARQPAQSFKRSEIWLCQKGTSAGGHASFSLRALRVKCSSPLYFLMIFTTTRKQTPITMGKYRIAACPSQLPSGQFAAQVSIASGHGSASTDRVMRFHNEFASHDAAARYAVAQGIDWVRASTRPH